MLPLNSLPTCPLAGESLPEGHVWTEVQAQRVFKRGSWFDSLAQLKLNMPRGEADNGLVDHLAKQLRTAADRFG